MRWKILHHKSYIHLDKNVTSLWFGATYRSKSSIPNGKLNSIMRENDELIAIFVSSIRTKGGGKSHEIIVEKYP